MNEYPDSLIAPLRDKDWLTASVSEVTGVELKVVQDRLADEYLHNPYAIPKAFYAQNLTPHVYNEGMIRFYEDTDSFIYGIIAWNSTSVKCRMREWILDFLHRNGLTSGKILLCGDGIGCDSFYFAKQGFEITSFEVSKFGVALAAKMLRDYGIQSSVWTFWSTFRIPSRRSASPPNFCARVVFSSTVHRSTSWEEDGRPISIPIVNLPEKSGFSRKTPA